MAGICGDKYEHTNGLEYICTEPPGHDWELGTMHECSTFLAGPVNW